MGEPILIKQYEELRKLLSRKIVDWERVEAIVASIGPQINDRYVEDPHDDENDTILSKLYLEANCVTKNRNAQGVPVFFYRSSLPLDFGARL